MHSVSRIASAAISLPRYFLRGLLKRFMTAPCFLWAQAIAFKVLVTLLPLILLATGIFGMVLRHDNPFEAIATFLRTFLPPNRSEQLVQMIFRLQDASGTLTLVGAAALLIAVVTLFSTMRYVIGSAMGEQRQHMRPIVAGYLFDLRMLAQVGVLFLLSFGLTLGINVLLSQSTWLVTRLGVDVQLIENASRGLFRVLIVAVPYLLTVAMLVQLYYFIPRPKPPLRSALLGAILAAVLFEAAKTGFALYATYIGNFDRYAATDADALGSLGGIFGLILALVFWVYLSGLILVIGAAVTGLDERRRGEAPPERQDENPASPLSAEEDGEGRHRHSKESAQQTTLFDDETHTVPAGSALSLAGGVTPRPISSGNASPESSEGAPTETLKANRGKSDPSP